MHFSSQFKKISKAMIYGASPIYLDKSALVGSCDQYYASSLYFLDRVLGWVNLGSQARGENDKCQKADEILTCGEVGACSQEGDEP